MVYVRALERAQHIAGVGGKRLYVAALPLGEDCVEGQRRLTAAAETGDHTQLIVRYGHVDILKVVDTGAVDFYGVGGILLFTHLSCKV